MTLVNILHVVSAEINSIQFSIITCIYEISKTFSFNRYNFLYTFTNKILDRGPSLRLEKGTEIRAL